MLTALLLLSPALARPTDNRGAWSFSSDDTVVSLDSENGLVRVWYSVEGPNEVLADDEDADGIPDFAQLVAATTEHVLGFYADFGFRPPLTDGDGGGSDAMDVYLVDFAGNADGMYAAETCSGSPRQCSGYFAMENDFVGYGYSNLSKAVTILTSHELFHAVQAAYDADEEVWFSEGTAVWAEHLYDPENEDFLYFCGAYLDDVGRSLNEPPAGPVPTFAYATAIWWWFLANRYGDGFLVDLLEATETGEDVLVDMAALEEAGGGSLREDWTTFAQWNLATGVRSGALEGYPFAARLGAPNAEVSGSSIVDDNRYYPLATTYFELEHEGGEVWFATEADAPELAFSFHAADADGDVEPALASFSASAEPLSLGELPAGSYWLVGTNPTLAEDSTKLVTCLGDAETVAACAPAAADTGDTADTGNETPEPEGCGCDGAGTGAGVSAVLLALLAIRRRSSRSG